ncbi:MAG: acyl-CoA thioesterase [Bacteroidetes bacterium]|nr:acyl-CoA thioesterase [Bacteroidota bacterium]
MFKHKSPLHIRFSDVDAFGHVNNACYLTYIEEARVSYFEEVVDWSHDWSTKGIIIAKAEIDFILPYISKKKLLCTHDAHGSAQKVLISNTSSHVFMKAKKSSWPMQ